ncbi:MAG: DUF6265 family protein [Bacteroidota bacterium]
MKSASFKLLTILISLGALVGCKSKVQSNFERAHWIIGNWANQTAKSITYETWKMVNEQELTAKSYVLDGKDTLLLETIQFIQQAEGTFYIPAVVNQNEGLPVRFTLSQLTDTSWVVENPAHDFPQKIAYRQIAKDSLVATISGIQNGEERSVNFSMVRVK